MKKLLILVLLMPIGLFAQVLNNSDLRSDGVSVDISYLESEIEYDVDTGGTVDLERNVIGGTVNIPLCETSSFYVGGGAITEASFENTSIDGDGTIITAGLKNRFIQKDDYVLTGYLNYNYIDEDLDDNSVAEVDGLQELEVGAIASLAASERVGVFGGVSVVAYSDGELEVAGSKTDIEREDIFNLRVGANVALTDALNLRLEGTFVGEETLKAGIGFGF